MTSQFLIGPITDGLRKDIKPFATPEDSFQTLQNAYQFRGRIIRKPGYSPLIGSAISTSRLSPDGVTFPGNPVMGLRTRELFALGQQQLIGFDTTSAYTWTGTVFNTLSSEMPVTWSGTDSQFFWTTNYAGAFWATNGKPGLNGVNITNVVAGSGITTITTTVNTFVSGQSVTFVNINPNSSSDLNGNVYVITVLTNTTFTIPFQTLTGYVSNGIALDSLSTTTGQDGIRYYAQTTVGNTWVNYNPPVDPNNALAGALLIFAYKGYLVFLNTTEGNETGTQSFPNRARWTSGGTPYYSPPAPITPSMFGVDSTTARDDIFGRGGAIDAPTSEAIVGAGFIRDILIVYFERSTWRLRFVNNSQNPFEWERINVEFGCDCTFSPITFDKGLIAIGNRGIIISDANDVVRIDEKIPDDVFNIRQSNEGFQRVYGIRTFEQRLLYWTYPSDDNPLGTYPDEVLVYNYDSKNWSYYDDCFTCFGYFYPGATAQTWSQMTNEWQSYNIPWNDGLGSQGEETVIAGNQQGFVFMLNQTEAQNSPSLAISAFTAADSGVVTSANNNLPDGSWIKLTGITGITSSDGVSLNNRNFKIANPSNDPNNFILTQFAPIAAPNASPTSTELTYSYDIDYVPILPNSVNIWIGSDLYQDTNGVGIIQGPNGLGTINYTTGELNITFISPYTNTSVNIYVVSYSIEQTINPVMTEGVYAPGGLITKISNFNITTKFFNFFKDDKRVRLSKIDFYTNQSGAGQLTCNVFTDSSNEPCNQPLPDNLQSNVILTTENPYQFGSGDQTIFRLWADVLGQTLQLQLTLSDQQMAVDAINGAAFELLSMILSIKKGGRII